MNNRLQALFASLAVIVVCALGTTAATLAPRQSSSCASNTRASIVHSVADTVTGMPQSYSSC